MLNQLKFMTSEINLRIPLFIQSLLQKYRAYYNKSIHLQYFAKKEESLARFYTVTLKSSVCDPVGVHPVTSF